MATMSDAVQNADLYRRVERAQREMWAKGLGLEADGWNNALYFHQGREAKERFTVECEERAATAERPVRRRRRKHSA